MTIRLREVDDGRWEVALNYVVKARVGASMSRPEIRKHLPPTVYKQIALLRMVAPYKYVKNVGFRDHAGYFFIDTPDEENFR